MRYTETVQLPEIDLVVSPRLWDPRMGTVVGIYLTQCRITCLLVAPNADNDILQVNLALADEMEVRLQVLWSDNSHLPPRSALQSLCHGHAQEGPVTLIDIRDTPRAD